MSILKALQKKQAEQSLETETVTNNAVFEKKSRRANLPPELFTNKNPKIGASRPAFDERAGLETENVDQTASNAFGLTSINEKRLPKFVRWSVDAEFVHPRLVAITQPHSTYCEEYRSLRTQVLHKGERQKLQSIVIASVNSSEGKSVTALNLSWLLAQTDGISALIIDGNLRKPSLTNYLAIETETGLSEVLTDKACLKDSIIRLEPAGLHLLPGGTAQDNEAELISGRKFKEILGELCEIFDYVIIDAPPLGIFNDAAVLINHADGALLVVCANKTRYSDVDRILESLPREKLLGAVLNQSADV